MILSKTPFPRRRSENCGHIGLLERGIKVQLGSTPGSFSETGFLELLDNESNYLPAGVSTASAPL